MSPHPVRCQVSGRIEITNARPVSDSRRGRGMPSVTPVARSEPPEAAAWPGRVSLVRRVCQLPLFRTLLRPGKSQKPAAGRRGFGGAAPGSEATERSEGDREFRCHVSYRELRSHFSKHPNNYLLLGNVTAPLSENPLFYRVFENRVEQSGLNLFHPAPKSVPPCLCKLLKQLQYFSRVTAEFPKFKRGFDATGRPRFPDRPRSGATARPSFWSCPCAERDRRRTCGRAAR